MRSLPNERWTVGDVRAEIARSLAISKLANAPTLERLRELADRVGMPELLEPFVEELWQTLLPGQTLPTTCPRCTLSYRPVPGAPEDCPACELQTVREAERLTPLGFLAQSHGQLWDAFAVCEPLSCAFAPRQLWVSPRGGDWSDAHLVQLLVGNRMYVTGPPLPLALFCPASWADAALMRQVQWDCALAPAGTMVTLQIALPTRRAVDFSAVLWGIAPPPST